MTTELDQVREPYGHVDSSTSDAARSKNESKDAAPSHRGSNRRDAGFTLVEAVVTIALMSIVVVPVLGAVMASIEASSRSRSAAQIETVLVNASDRVNRAPKTCGYVDYVQAALGAQRWDPSLATVVEEHSRARSDSEPAGLVGPRTLLDRHPDRAAGSTCDDQDY